MRVFSLFIGVLLPTHAYAASLQDYFPCNGYFFCGGVGGQPGDTANQLAFMIAERVVGFIALVCFLAIVYGGLRMIVARGQAEGIEAGKKAIMWAVAGFIAVMLAIAMIEFVQQFISDIPGGA